MALSLEPRKTFGVEMIDRKPSSLRFLVQVFAAALKELVPTLNTSQAVRLISTSVTMAIVEDWAMHDLAIHKSDPSPPEFYNDPEGGITTPQRTLPEKHFAATVSVYWSMNSLSQEPGRWNPSIGTHSQCQNIYFTLKTQSS
jgi:hypothetical protein